MGVSLYFSQSLQTCISSIIEKQGFANSNCKILQLNGAVRYSDVDNVCLASSSRGSVKSALNRRDPEYHLLDGFLNFYVEEDLR